MDSDSDNDEFYDAHEELAFQRFNSFRNSFLTYRIPEKQSFNTQKTEYVFEDKFDDSIDDDYLNDETIELINIFNIYNIYNIYYNAEEYVTVKTEDTPCSSESYPPIAPPRTKRGSRRVTKLKEITYQDNNDDVKGASSQCAGAVVRSPHRILPAPDHSDIKDQCIEILDGINLSIDGNSNTERYGNSNTERYLSNFSNNVESSLVLYNSRTSSGSAYSERYPSELVNIEELSHVPDNDKHTPTRTIKRRRSAGVISKDVTIHQGVSDDERPENVTCNRKRSLSVICRDNESSDIVAIDGSVTVKSPNKKHSPNVVYDDEEMPCAVSINGYSSNDRCRQKRISRVTIHKSSTVKSPNKEHSSCVFYDDEEIPCSVSINGYSSDDGCRQKCTSRVTIDKSSTAKTTNKKHSSSVVYDDEQLPGVIGINEYSSDESCRKKYISSVNYNEKQWPCLTSINDSTADTCNIDEISPYMAYIKETPSNALYNGNQPSDDIIIDEYGAYSSNIKCDEERSSSSLSGDELSSGSGEYSSNAHINRRRPDINYTNWRSRRFFRNDEPSAGDDNINDDLSHSPKHNKYLSSPYINEKSITKSEELQKINESTENTFQNSDENEGNVMMYNGISNDIQEESSSYYNDVNTVEGRELLSDKLVHLSQELPLDSGNDRELLSEKLANLSLTLPIIKTPPKSRRYSTEEETSRSPHRLSLSRTSSLSTRRQSKNYHSPFNPLNFEETDKASNLVHLYSTTNGRLRYERTVDLDLLNKAESTDERFDNGHTKHIQETRTHTPPPLNSLTVQELTDEEILNQVITSDDLLNEEEILEQVFIKDLDTGEMIPLSVAEEKLSHPDNALRLHIMRINIDGSRKQAASHSGESTATTVLQEKRKQLKRFIEKTRRKIKSVATKYSVDHKKIDSSSDRSSLFVNEHDCDSVNRNQISNLSLLYDKDDSNKYEGGYKFKARNYNKFKDELDTNLRHQTRNKEHTMLDHIRLLKDLCGGHIGAIWTMNFVLYGKLLANAGKENIVRVWVMKDAALNFAEMRKQYTYHPLNRPGLEGAPFNNETNIEFLPGGNELLI